MREIKFRGKCTPEFPHPTVKWVYGSLVSDSKKKKKTVLICVHLPVPTRDGNTFWYEVYADTVGQYTGLKDSEGKEIYEGDVIQIVTKNPYWAFKKNYAVYWDLDGFCLEGEPLYYWFKLHDLKVIGNAHDNPELLERMI